MPNWSSYFPNIISKGHMQVRRLHSHMRNNTDLCLNVIPECMGLLLHCSYTLICKSTFRTFSSLDVHGRHLVEGPVSLRQAIVMYVGDSNSVPTCQRKLSECIYMCNAERALVDSGCPFSSSARAELAVSVFMLPFLSISILIFLGALIQSDIPKPPKLTCVN